MYQALISFIILIVLVSFFLHEPHTASTRVLIGDGTCLSIANTGSFTLTSLPTPLLFTNVLHVPVMYKNLISVSTLYADSPINVFFFFTLSFKCRIVTWGSLWFKDIIEMVSITSRSQSLFGLLPSICLLQFSPHFSLSPCGIVV